MKIKTNFILTTLATLILLNGCSKDVEEYNKPAIYWYTKMIEHISNGNLEKADDYYSSLEGEHIGSPLLPEATMILAIAHMHNEEYILSEHFLNEYVKRYANPNEKEFAEFAKIKAKYMSLPNPRRDQSLIQEAIIASQQFKREYPHSMYYAIVDTMLTRLYIAEAALNESIADLYDRLGKPKAARYYRAIKPEPWIDWNDIDRVNSAWYRQWFEGDGTSSWYGFMIPDLQSVVSRNSINEDSSIEDNYYLQNETHVSKSKENIDIQTAKELRDKGALSEEEFEAIQSEILGKEIAGKTQTTKPNQNREILQAKELMDDGALSEEEFKEIRDEILVKEEAKIVKTHKTKKVQTPWYKSWFSSDDEKEPKIEKNSKPWYDFLPW